jgi:hypothetical protein
VAERGQGGERRQVPLDSLGDGPASLVMAERLPSGSRSASAEFLALAFGLLGDEVGASEGGEAMGVSPSYASQVVQRALSQIAEERPDLARTIV